MCVYVCQCMWNARRHARVCPASVPAGHARRACPKGTLEERVPKGPRRDHCGRRPSGGAGGGEGGWRLAPKKFSQKKFFFKNFPKGRKWVLEGGRGGRSPPQKKKGREAPHNYLVILTLMKFFVAISCCNCIDFLLNNLHGLHTNFCRNFIHT